MDLESKSNQTLNLSTMLYLAKQSSLVTKCFMTSQTNHHMTFAPVQETIDDIITLCCLFMATT
jgi:hypothetical protein